MHHWHSKLYSVFTRSASLKSSIYLAALSMMMAVAFFMLQTLHSRDELARLTHDILDVRIITMSAAQRVKLAFVAHDGSLFHFLATKDISALDDSDNLKALALAEIQQLKQRSTSQVQTGRLEILEFEANRYLSDAEALITAARRNRLPVNASTAEAAAWARDQGARRIELRLLSSEGRGRLLRIFSLCDEVLTFNRIELEKAQHEMDQVLKRSRDTAIAGGLIASLIVICIAIALAVRLLGPLRALLDGVRQLEAGHMNVEIPVTGTDEVALLTSAFNRMTRTMREQKEQLVHQTITDGLTGTFNQRHFRHLLKQEIERSRRSNLYLSLLMIDIDFFKTYNDTQGHESGNEVLKSVCNTISEHLRDMDALARYGGDELAVILPDTSPEEARALAERLQQAVATLRFPGDEKLPHGRVTLSIGGCTFPEEAASASDLVEKADQALYSAKEAGRNCVRWSSSPFTEPRTAHV